MIMGSSCVAATRLFAPGILISTILSHATRLFKVHGTESMVENRVVQRNSRVASACLVGQGGSMVAELEILRYPPVSLEVMNIKSLQDLALE